MRWTTTDPVLDGRELATTGLAAATSTAFYLRGGHSYLARGVVGDVLGLAVLSVALHARRRRVRHEAVACLAGIAAVHAARPAWPLRVPAPLWWLVIAAGVAAYHRDRRLVLSGAGIDEADASTTLCHS